MGAYFPRSRKTQTRLDFIVIATERHWRVGNDYKRKGVENSDVCGLTSISIFQAIYGGKNLDLK